MDRSKRKGRKNQSLAKLAIAGVDSMNSHRCKRPTTPKALWALSVFAAIVLDRAAVALLSSRISVGDNTRFISFPWTALVVGAEAVKVDDVESDESTHDSNESVLPEKNDETETTTTTTTMQSGSESESFDEDVLVQETIKAGRGDRDEWGVRDQWESDEHLNDRFDSRKPISGDVLRLLKAYRLECEGCDHHQAVRTVNAYVKETKRVVEAGRVARERRDAWARRIFGTFALVLVSFAYVFKNELSKFLGLDAAAGGDFDGFSSAQRAELVRMRREQAARAANQRQQQRPPPEATTPTWLDNEQKEIWNPKQEKQFQIALREFSGVPKKDRYRLIAEKVQGKSRIECLTHHKMQELLKKREEQQQL